MATNYTWDVSTVDTYSSHTDNNNNTESDVIFKVHWKLNGDDGTNQTSIIGEQELDVSNLAGFAEFDDVTTSNIQTWVTAAIGASQVQRMKDSIQAKLTDLATPQVVTRTVS